MHAADIDLIEAPQVTNEMFEINIILIGCVDVVVECCAMKISLLESKNLQKYFGFVLTCVRTIWRKNGTLKPKPEAREFLKHQLVWDACVLPPCNLNTLSIYTRPVSFYSVHIDVRLGVHYVIKFIVYYRNSFPRPGHALLYILRLLSRNRALSVYDRQLDDNQYYRLHSLKCIVLGQI
uniref:Uncharacterized protein n=1 Tax=Glossina austeni TaxID=7395 RepID=A0A1A9UXY6_GLOAU